MRNPACSDITCRYPGARDTKADHPASTWRDRSAVFHAAKRQASIALTALLFEFLLREGLPQRFFPFAT
jgi:hypothetical protein